MSYGFLDVATTSSVRAVQARMGADRIWQDFKGHRESLALPERGGVHPDRDSFQRRFRNGLASSIGRPWLRGDDHMPRARVTGNT